MNDLLGRKINKEDIILINNRVYMVTASYSNSIKYIGEPNGHVSSTYMSEKVLIISDFDQNLISNKILDNADKIESLKNSKTKVLSPEEIKRIEAENKTKLALKKSQRAGSIVIDKSNNLYVYLGKHKNDVTNKDEHIYFCCGYTNRNGSNFEYLKNQIIDLDHVTYSTYVYANSTLKQPHNVNNDYNNEIITFFKNANTNRFTNMRYKEFYDRVINICKTL